MARNIELIETDIILRLQTSFSLSSSSAAEWRMWVHCVAYAIHVFELALDAFRSEMDTLSLRQIAGTVNWYNAKCYEFQEGHDLYFDDETGILAYRTDDPDSRIIKIAAVNTGQDGTIFFRIATKDSETGEVIPVSDKQLINFKNYIDAIKFAGTKSSIISTTADQVRYNISVYYNPATPIDMVRSSILTALADFKTSQKFGGILYSHRMQEAVSGATGVVACKINTLTRKGTEDPDFLPVDAISYLHAGYFNFTDDSQLTLTSINDL